MLVCVLVNPGKRAYNDYASILIIICNTPMFLALRDLHTSRLDSCYPRVDAHRPHCVLHRGAVALPKHGEDREIFDRRLDDDEYTRIYVLSQEAWR